MSAYGFERDEWRNSIARESDRLLGQADCRHLCTTSGVCQDCGFNAREEVNQ